MLKPIEAGCQALAIDPDTPVVEVTVCHYVGEDPRDEDYVIGKSLWHVEPEVEALWVDDLSHAGYTNLVDEKYLMRIDGEFEITEEQTDELSF